MIIEIFCKKWQEQKLGTEYSKLVCIMVDVADYKAFKNFNSKIHIHMPYIYIYR